MDYFPLERGVVGLLPFTSRARGGWTTSLTVQVERGVVGLLPFTSRARGGWTTSLYK